MLAKEKIPNLLTISRFFLSAAVVVLLSIPTSNNLYLDVTLYGLIAAVLFLISAFTDYLDGYLSRRWMCDSTFGKIFDPLADKFLVCGTIICLMCKGSLNVLVGSVLVIRDIIMDFLIRPILYKKGRDVGAVSSAKWKTATQMIGLTAILFFCSNKVLGTDPFWPITSGENWKNWLSHLLIFLSAVFSIVSFCVYLKKLVKPKTYDL